MTRSSPPPPPRSPPSKLDTSSMSISITTTHSSKNCPTTPTKATSFFSPKLSIYILTICVSIFIIFQIKSLQTLQPSTSPTSNDHHISTPSTNIMSQFINNCLHNSTSQITSLTTKLRQSVTFLPLKDLRFSSTPLDGHTWFMSSLTDKQEPGEVQHQHFPSNESHNRILCLKGNDTHDGANNYYALAWPEALPLNATLLKGLTFISNNHYDYDNIWHGLSAMVPFVAWHKRNQCQTVPSRWILYHWGEVRRMMGPWVRKLMEGTFEGDINIETFEKFKKDEVACFEEAVVMRHNEGGMSKEKRIEVYDLLRCKARVYCNLSISGGVLEGDENGSKSRIGMTIFMRSGARSFKNESVVLDVFRKECEKVEGCKFQAAYSNNLTFCQQVKLMGETDVLISPHGAQLTNMFLMNRNSSVMEFFPKGWLKLAGVGQFVYHWIASWSGMQHKGAWRDPDGEECPFGKDDKMCMSFYKDGLIGHNRTHFSEWGRAVLNEVKAQKIEQAMNGGGESFQDGCPC